MTDAQDLINFARDNFNKTADALQQHVEHVAANLRESIEWLGLVQHPPPPPPPPPRFSMIAPASYWHAAQTWVSKNRAASAAIVAFLGTGAAMVLWKRRERGRRRRAKRFANGARKEIVVIAGSPSSPVLNSLMLDLERRGFIVYVVVQTPEEEQYVRSQSRVDLLPLQLDVTD
ncbi:hypothetical protein LTR66_015324, partial [Elasticomyces elasticus]